MSNSDSEAEQRGTVHTMSSSTRPGMRRRIPCFHTAPDKPPRPGKADTEQTLA